MPICPLTTPQSFLSSPVYQYNGFLPIATFEDQKHERGIDVVIAILFPHLTLLKVDDLSIAQWGYWCAFL